MTIGMPDWALEVPFAPVHQKPSGTDLTRPFTAQQLIEFGLQLMEQLIKRVVLAVAGFFIPGLPSFDQLKNWAENLPGQITRFINNIAGIDLSSWDNFVASLADGKGIDLPLLKAAIDFLSILFGGIDLHLPHNAAEVWRLVANVFLAPLNLFAIPADVQVSINMALGYTKAALEGTYIGTDPIFLAVQTAAAKWLTGSSTLNSANLTGPIGDGLLPGLGAVRDAIYQAIHGGSTTGVTAAQVKSSLTTLTSDAAAAGSDASAALENWATTITQIYNRWSGNNAGSASQSQADAAMATAASTIGQHTAWINALQNMMEGAGGFSASVMFRQPETVAFDVPGPFNYVPPPWFRLGVDTVDEAKVGGGGGAQGVNFGLPGTDGTDGGASSLTINGVTRTAPGGLGNSSLVRTGLGPGPITFLDILYPGGANQSVNGGNGNSPGGGGASHPTSVGIGHGGGPGGWDTASTIPTSLPITGTVGAGGSGGSGLPVGSGSGAPGAVYVRARAAMPAEFTSLGTQILPTFKLNTGVALTDAMTAAAVWSRVPPGGAAGGHMLKIRSNAAGTSYVYLRVWYVSGVTHYELGTVVSGTKTPWKSGTITEAIPFNAFSLTSDNSYTFTIGINGSGFNSYIDAAHLSSMGALYRGGDWASSDSALPGSIMQFAFLDTGTPSRITSNTVATPASTTSTTYADLTGSTGPSVTLNVPPSGEIVVDLSAALAHGGSAVSYMGFVLSGANTRAASDAESAAARNGSISAGVFATPSRRIPLAGLNAGTTTIKAVYRTAANTATFSDRILIVEPKP
jgi:hypothetical protein